MDLGFAMCTKNRLWSMEDNQVPDSGLASRSPTRPGTILSGLGSAFHLCPETSAAIVVDHLSSLVFSAAATPPDLPLSWSLGFGPQSIQAEQTKRLPVGHPIFVE